MRLVGHHQPEQGFHVWLDIVLNDETRAWTES